MPDPATISALRDLGFIGGAFAVGILFALGIIVSGKSSAKDKADIRADGDARLAEYRAMANERYAEVKADRDAWKKIAEDGLEDRERLVGLFDDLRQRPVSSSGSGRADR